ncbi:MAG TPA: EAL domain-containing protein, partial [Acidimicrobiales bacterium]|nr:EAL domain-containing protein [Acidimicrobiales bacterium]
MDSESDEASPRFDDLALIVEVDPGPVFRVVAAGGGPVVRGEVPALPPDGTAIEDFLDGVTERSRLHLESVWTNRLPQTYLVDRDGDLYDVTITPVFDCSGTCTQLFTHTVARKERPRDVMNAAILDALPEAVALVDAGGTVRSVNLAWVRQEIDIELPEPGATYDDDAVRAVLDGTSDGTTECRTIGDRSIEVRAEPLRVDGERWAIVVQDDVTALTDAVNLWQSSFAAAAVPMLWSGSDGLILEANPAAGDLLGRRVEELVGRRTSSFVDVEGRGPRRARRSRLGGSEPGTRESCIARPDGTVRTVVVHAAPVSAGGDRGVVVQLVDITSQRTAEARLALHGELLELVAAGTPVDEVALAVAANIGRAISGASGAVVLRDGPPVCAPDLDAPWLPFVGSLTGVDVPSTPYRCVWSAPIVSPMLASPGAVVVLRRGSAPISSDDEEAANLLASVLRLAIQRDETAGAVATAALHDQSSGLPTSVLFGDRLSQAIDRLATTRTALAVLAMGIEGYDETSATDGWRAAERELATVATCVADLLPAPHELARRGNHLVAMVEVLAMEDIGSLVQQLRDRAGTNVSIGATVITSALATPERALHEAEAALRTARRSAPGWALFDPAVDAQQRLAVADLCEALDEGGIEVHYQPIVDLRDGTVVGLEALVRWHDAERGAVPPPRIIEIAETGGVLDELSALVLATACRDLASWHERAPHLTMAVNLSGSQLGDPRLVGTVTAALDKAGVPPSSLVLEITESVVVEDVDQAVRALAALREVGVRVAIDDFGTGYSSLLYLKRFPADVLKVDRAFVQGLGVSEGDTAIVDAVVGLGHRLGLEVVAEGVETEHQLDELRKRRCDQAQGYLLLRPGPAAALDELITAGRVE